MKIKQIPDDFHVDEISNIDPTDGPFALYRLTKSGWTTSDALSVIRRAWHVSPVRVSFGGLKDRHARTTQHVTIDRGPRRDFSQRDIALAYLGQTPEAFTSRDITANWFQIAIRDVTQDELDIASGALDEVRRDGLANYFDDQRFGSVEGADEFMARRLVLGDWEGALKLALTGDYEYDRAAQRREKAILARHWGDWSQCLRKLPRCDSRRIVGYLAAQRSDFRGAIGGIPSELSSLYLSAFQSHLWNRMLARWLERRLPPGQRVLVPLKLAEAPMPHGIPADLRENLARWVLPLPSARLHYDAVIEQAPTDWPSVVRAVMADEGIELEQMKLKGLRRPFFARGERAVHCQPANLSADAMPDERHHQRFKLVLRFDLPRGSYGTLVVKRVTQSRPATGDAF